MVHFSGKARKMNHLSSFSASEASRKAFVEKPSTKIVKQPEILLGRFLSEAKKSQ
ncbi:MAG: hypothetical protein U5L45_11190 [Saprospiraceae bacterium]|nr:hypothetical protein [Saprospiraceae bacterium]